MITLAGSPALIVKLVGRVVVAENTMAFEFERPRDWSFKAGQAIDMTLLHPPETDTEGNKRAFSIASGPTEPTLTVATRMRDTAFKRVLKSMPVGSEVRIEGPFGDLSLHNNSARPAVFLAGGIGITLFRSIVKHAAKEKLPHRLLLFYSNRQPADAAFLEELQSLETQNPNYKMIATMTGTENALPAWGGETGHVNKEMLDRYLPVLALPGEGRAPIYYIAGPPQMVHGMQAMLAGAGVDSDDVRIEEFAGY
jgi:ferredoxin-NADP reductase